MDARIVIGIVVALGAGWVIMDLEYNQGAAYPPAEATVQVEGPDGMVWSGLVLAPEGTAFHALLEASAIGGFDVEWTGPEGKRFVEAIAGIGPSGGGWCVQVDGEDSPTSVDRFHVDDGQTVRWYWTTSQCDRF